MEDAHIANVNLDEDCCIFGVFDGHGGELPFSIYKKVHEFSF